MKLYCPSCKVILERVNTEYICGGCHTVFSDKKTVPSFISEDRYWGEFPEADLEKALVQMRDGRYEEARRYLSDLGRDDFIFGVARSDFLLPLSIDKNSVCLDVGCGLGIHSFNIAKRAGEVWGFDQSLSRVEFCNLRAKMHGVSNTHFFHSDLLHLPFSPGTFDVILMNGVLEWVGEMNLHTDPREDQLEILRYLRTLLKPNGILYVGIENRFAFAYLKNGIDHNGLRFTSFLPRFLASYITRKKKGKSYRTYTYGMHGYKKIFSDAGFEIKHAYVAHPGYNLPKYLIPFYDVSAFSFFISSFAEGKGVLGSVASKFTHAPLFSRIARHFFYSFAFYVTPGKKETSQ